MVYPLPQGLHANENPQLSENDRRHSVGDLQSIVVCGREP